MATALGGFKAIAPVPSASDFIDIALSSTQRKLPTVIHKNFKISRIRNFYMRKVKFCANTIDERIGKILTEFPILENLHPFLMHFLNILYDKEHWKIALGQLNKARHLVDQVAKDYLRLLKFSDSLYRAKQLKRAALGRMATILKGQKNALEFLEQVRQHLNRLPAIDPNTRTLIICGFPNVGKSSFMNKVTRADVETAPYPFTTKALHVGHTDYKYLRWQIIDTPGILDHDIKDMNVIEMQSITALAHLRAACLYFMDLSEQCGYTVEAQCKLFQSIQPLFREKPVIVVFNKIDVARYEDLTPENKAFVDEIVNQPGIQAVSSSTITEEGVMGVRDAACDLLLAHRVDQKMRGSRIDAVANKLHVAVPKQRDTKARPAFIPAKALEKKKYDKTDPERIRLERDEEQEMSGLGIFTQDLKKNYILDNDDWKYDIMPEFMDGKNVADFFSADIAEQLTKLEAEEERLDGEGFYESGDEEELNSEEEELADAAAQIAKQKAQLKLKSQAKHINRAVIPRKAKNVTLKEFTTGMRQIGLDPKHLERRAAVLSEKEKAAYEAYVKRQEAREAAEGGMDVDAGPDFAPRPYLHKMTKSDEQVIEEFNDYVNMSADELREWLDGEDSQSAGWSKDNSGKVKEGEESVGHESGRKIIDILERNPKKDPSKYTDEDLQHMRKVAAYCARHTKQESHMLDEKSDEELEKTKSVRSLRNWGHDPLKTK